MDSDIYDGREMFWALEQGDDYYNFSEISHNSNKISNKVLGVAASIFMLLVVGSMLIFSTALWF